MTITIKATNIELTPALRDYAEKRLAGLEKYGPLNLVEVELGKTTNHHRSGEIFRAEVMVTTALGKIHRADTERTDLYEAIDVLRDESMRVLRSAKGRDTSLFRRGAQKIKRILKGVRS